MIEEDGKMKRIGKFLILTIALMFLFGASVAQATFLYFDNLTTPNHDPLGNVADYGTIGTYQSIIWTGWDVMKGTGGGNDYMTVYGNDEANIPSPNNFILNGMEGNRVVTATITGGGEFNFLGAYISSFVAANDFIPGFSSLNITIEGYDDTDSFRRFPQRH
jgi:hypothetical protein